MIQGVRSVEMTPLTSHLVWDGLMAAWRGWNANAEELYNGIKLFDGQGQIASAF